MRCMSFLKFSCAVLALVLSFALVSAAVTGGAQSRPLITSAINENNTVTLHGNTIAYANAQTDRGRVSDTLALEHLQLILRRPAEQEQSLQKYIDDLQKPGSSSSPNSPILPWHRHYRRMGIWWPLSAATMAFLPLMKSTSRCCPTEKPDG